MRYVAGIDFNTSEIDVVRLPLDPAADWRTAVRAVTIKFRGPKEDAFRAVARIPEAIAHLLGTPHLMPCDLAYIEHGFGASRRSDWALGRVQGAVVAALAARNVVVEEVPLQTWRAGVGIRPNAKKADTLPALRALGFDFERADLLEAGAIALYARITNAEMFKKLEARP